MRVFLEKKQYKSKKKKKERKQVEKDSMKKVVTESNFLKVHFDGYGWCCSCLLVITSSAA